jgi:hypothetical protein
MTEEAVSVLGSYRLDGRTHRFNQNLAASGRCPAQQRLDLGEGLF